MQGQDGVPSEFSIVSFNVMVGGVAKSSDTTSLDQIAWVLSRGTIAAVQEVTHRRFARALNSRLGLLGNYKSAYVEIPGESDKEEGLFTYDADRAEFLDHLLYPDVNRDFLRTPVTGVFRVGHKELGVMSYHANFGRGNSLEIKNIPRALDHARRILNIENIVLAADTNLGSEPRGLKTPYFTRYGMRKPQAFPWPGIDTTNGRESATYDYIIWDGSELVACGSELIKFSQGSQFLVNVMDSTGVGYILPGVRRDTRKEVTKISDHWGIRVDFHLKDDYSQSDIKQMSFGDKIFYGAIRGMRALGAKRYDFPEKTKR
jgi:hypothetical protein